MGTMLLFIVLSKMSLRVISHVYVTFFLPVKEPSFAQAIGPRDLFSMEGMSLILPPEPFLIYSLMQGF